MTKDIPFASNEALDPATISILVSAFENALQSLNARDSEFNDPYSTRQKLAKHIIERALAGERDVERLCEAALSHLRGCVSLR